MSLYVLIVVYIIKIFINIFYVGGVWSDFFCSYFLEYWWKLGVIFGVKLFLNDVCVVVVEDLGIGSFLFGV